MQFEISRDNGEYIIFLCDDKGKHLTTIHPYSRSLETASTMMGNLYLIIQNAPRIEQDEENGYVQHYLTTSCPVTQEQVGGNRYAIGPCVEKEHGQRIGNRLTGYFNGTSS